jgi:tungstate transport system substrate-binding protein
MNNGFMRRHSSVLLALLLIACRGGDGAQKNRTSAGSRDTTTPVVATRPVVGAAGRIQLVLASTTSTEDSGLFSVLLPAFEKANPQYVIRLIAVGTGQALELGRRKDADVLLVHAPAAESEFVSKGYGEKRCLVMYNDFVIVGPPSDAAHVRGSHDATAALRAISKSGVPFVSRGDDSGTHKKEKSLWEEAHLTPGGPWYLSTGQGMGEVLSIASEKGAYTLADRGTYLAVKEHNQLEVMVEGDKRLINQYGVIPVTDARNRKGAAAFAAWITSPEGQRIIGDFGIARFGQALFIPNANGCSS